jgi:fibronectin type 3 domain-containing protein
VSGLVFPQTVNNNTSVPFTVTYTPTSATPLNTSINFNTTTSPFTVVENVTASPFNPAPHNVVLTWTASTSSVVGYNVYRGTQSGGPYTKVNIALVGGTTFTDFSVVSGTTYFYVVTAVDSLNHESPLSNEAKAVIPIP